MECACCKYVRPDYKMSGRKWIAYECGNSKSEYFRCLLNVSVGGAKQRKITWTGCDKGRGSAITAKEYLSQAFKINQRVVKMSEEIQILRARVGNPRQTLPDTPRGSKPDICRFEDLAVKIADMENAITVYKNKQTQLNKEISDIIGRVDNDTYRLLLQLRYLHYLDWMEIAHILGYDLRYTYKLHNKALQKVDIR